jgi:acyl dehydratase
MPLDPSYVGRVLERSGSYEIGREKIREFADAIGDPNPAYRDPESARRLGHPDVIAPPTFAIVLTLDEAAPLAADPAFGLDWGAVVHREQRFVYTRPLRAGDRLVVTTTVADIRALAGNDVLTLRSEVATDAGDHVVTCETTLVARAGAREAADPAGDR